MKVLVLSLLLLGALSVNLRASQSAGPAVDFLQPVELALQLFGQSFDTTMQSMELQLLTMLYPDNPADIQAQLDVCEENFWNSEVGNLQAINTDLLSLANSCSADDPSATVSKVIEDFISLISTIVANCDGLTVDLQTDLSNLIASMVVQGFQFSGPFVGPVNQLINGSLPPFALPPSLVSTIDGWFENVGSSVQAVDNTEVNASALIADWNRMQASVASTGAPTVEDTAASMKDLYALANTDGVIFAEIFRSWEQYITPAVQTMCSFAGPLLAFAAPPASN